MRWTNSSTSSPAKALPSESMGTACRTLENPAAGAAPTFCDGLSPRFSSGKRSSIASFRRLSAS